MFTSKLFEKIARERSPLSEDDRNDNNNMPFKGMGAMLFDDYNYKSLNKIIFNMKADGINGIKKRATLKINEEGDEDEESDNEAEEKDVNTNAGGEITLRLSA
jgi:hypothetical protein